MQRKILVIEDDPRIRQGVRLFLCAAGYEVKEARDGDEALDLLDKFRFHLVLSDVHSPRLQGIDVLSHLTLDRTRCSHNYNDGQSLRES